MLKEEDIKRIFINESGGIHPTELPEVEFIQLHELKQIAKQLKIANKLKLFETVLQIPSLGFHEADLFTDLFTYQLEDLTKIKDELYSEEHENEGCDNEK